MVSGKLLKSNSSKLKSAKLVENELIDYYNYVQILRKSKEVTN